jgi:hypothetical protein
MPEHKANLTVCALNGHTTFTTPPIRTCTKLQQQAKGDIIIVGINANEDVRGRTIKQLFAALQMHDAILSIHGTNCPSTNLNNESFEPIDVIFCSRAIRPIRAGFLGSDEGCPSDHIQLWADFENPDLIGGPIDEFHNHVVPLNIHDPRLVEAYNLKSFSQLQKENIISQLEELDKISYDNFTEDHTKRYNELCTLNTSIRQGVKAKLHHIFMGKLAWSPGWALTKLIKQLWLQVLRYRLL